MRANVKPLTHWIIYRGYKVRFSERTPIKVSGVLTTPAGELMFTYDLATQTVQMGSERVVINEYGWEMSKPNNE
jgi:hypothetical protein